MNTLAEKVVYSYYRQTGKIATIKHIPTPRNEKTTDHYYFYKTDVLESLGYVPTRSLSLELGYTIKKLLENKERLRGLEKNTVPKISF